MVDFEEAIDPADALRKELAHKDRMEPVPRSGRRMEWRFQAYRDLLQQLGHGDGMAEVMEVACRDFIDLAMQSGDPPAYLAARAAAQNIVVDELDMVNLPVRAATLFIVGAYQQLDAFLKDLVTEADSVCARQSRTRNTDECSADWALEMLPGGRPRNIRRVGTERYLVLEYYRGVRNAFTHPSKRTASLEAAFKRAAHYRPLFEADLRLQAPNPPDALSLDDFLLFTRTIKYVATDLCRIATPTLAEIEAHADRQIQSDRVFHATTWDTIGRDTASRKIIRFHKRFDYDIAGKPELVDRIVSNQFAKVGRF